MMDHVKFDVFRDEYVYFNNRFAFDWPVYTVFLGTWNRGIMDVHILCLHRNLYLEVLIQSSFKVC